MLEGESVVNLRLSIAHCGIRVCVSVVSGCKQLAAAVRKRQPSGREGDPGQGTIFPSVGPVMALLPHPCLVSGGILTCCYFIVGR